VSEHDNTGSGDHAADDQPTTGATPEGPGVIDSSGADEPFEGKETVGGTPTPAGGSPTGHEPNTRVVPGHEGETAWEAQGSILGRLKHPISTGGRVTKRGERQGLGRTGEGVDGDEAVRVSGEVTADSRFVPEQTAGNSYIGGAGIGSVEPQRATGVEDLDRRQERRSELVVAFWFLMSVAGTFAFVIMNFGGDKHKQYYTPVLGICLAVAVGGLGMGMINWAKRLMGDEEAVQEREPHFSKPEEVEATERVFARGVETSGITKRPIIRRTLLLAAGALGLIGVVPILNLGPLSGRKPKAFGETSWRFTKPTTDVSGKRVQGIRMIDQTGRPIKLGDLAAGGLLTVFPALTPSPDSPGMYEEPTLQEKGDSTVLLIRLRPGELKGANAKHTYFDHIAFSKICTHAGCPVSLYEQQTHHLLCPCHQSIFDVSDHGRPIFGPAARSLPQLAITVDSDGYFIATGDFTEPIGPTYWERNG
jgi:ubiquinol-cytochrome c reductase iron-sulfur subunit